MKKFSILLLVIFASVNLIHAQWSPDVRLTNIPAASLASYTRSTAIVANGNFVHVVWYDERDGNQEIYYKRSNDAGLSWGTDTRLTTNDSVSRQPAVAISDSNIHIVWDDTRDGNHEIYYKRSTDYGVNWGADIRLTIDTSWSGHPGLTVSGSNVYVVWRDSRDGNTEIYYKHSSDGGIIWSNDYRITNDTASSYNPSVLVSDSIVHIIWEDKRDGNQEIYYKRSTDGGLNWGPDIRVTNNSSVSNLPTSAVSGSYLYVVWNDSREGNLEIYYKLSIDAGITWGADKRLTDQYGYSWWSSVAASANGAHIVWQDNLNGNEEIYYMCSKDNGVNWNDILLGNNNSTLSEYPSIALSDSIVHVIWSDKRDGPNGEIYYKRNPTGNISRIEDIDIPKNYLTVYPNPASDHISISFTNVGLSDVSISIFNLLGIEIKRFNEKELFGKNTVDFSTKCFPSGVYYCTLNYGINKISRSFVVVR
ncbi:MAG: T9SS type A sorting domain-containing protein [Bacteroidetes bacterium]|nr:T9SS type A sorting domain-containing protein [Bacteroidota bacterium]